MLLQPSSLLAHVANGYKLWHLLSTPVSATILVWHPILGNNCSLMRIPGAVKQ